jgi:hypothetical protein
MNLTKRELEVINIVETAGVSNGSLKYEKVITEIYYWLQSTLRSVYGNKEKVGELNNGYFDTFQMEMGDEVYSYDEYHFMIPEEITKKVQWIKTFMIAAKVEDFKVKNETTAFYDPKGNSSGYPFDITDDDAMLQGFITISCKSFNGDIDRRTYNLVMEHELNHLYTSKSKLSHYVNDPKNNSKDKTEIIADFNSKEIDSHEIYYKINSNIGNRTTNLGKFCYIEYRLFFDDEKNALVDSVYGDLKGLNSKSYKDDIEKTQAYKVYSIIKNYIEILSKINVNDWKEFIPYVCKPFNSKTITDLDKFRNKFIKYTYFKLNDLFNRMGKTASFWYSPQNYVKEEIAKIDNNISSEIDKRTVFELMLERNISYRQASGIYRIKQLMYRGY